MSKDNKVYVLCLCTDTDQYNSFDTQILSVFIDKQAAIKTAIDKAEINLNEQKDSSIKAITYYEEKLASVMAHLDNSDLSKPERYNLGLKRNEYKNTLDSYHESAEKAAVMLYHSGYRSDGVLPRDATFIARYGSYCYCVFESSFVN
jgi:hypothetical protein